MRPKKGAPAEKKGLGRFRHRALRIRAKGAGGKNLIWNRRGEIEAAEYILQQLEGPLVTGGIPQMQVQGGPHSTKFSINIFRIASMVGKMIAYIVFSIMLLNGAGEKRFTPIVKGCPVYLDLVI